MMADDAVQQVAQTEELRTETPITNTLQLEAEALLKEANQMLARRDRDPKKLDHLKGQLMTLITSLTGGATDANNPLAGVEPTLLAQLTQAIPDLSSVASPLLLSPVEETSTELARVEETVQHPIVREDTPESEWVEHGKRVSECILWKLQEEYYGGMGIEAWNMVPFFVTSSTFIAESYAEMIISFLRDYEDRLDRNEPIYIVEMATGSGRFSNYLLKELTSKLEMFSRLKDLKVRYIMTDFTEKNILFWESHKNFQPYIESGMLDFAIFRPEDYQFLQLRRSKVKLSNKTVKNPMFAIANYFFDSIRQDVFQVQDGKLMEGRIKMWRDITDTVRPGDPVRVGQLGYNYDYVEVSHNYYKNDTLNQVLKYYQEQYYNATLVIPLGAIDTINNLLTLSNNNLVLVSSDKGFTDMEYMLGHRITEFAVHDGAFSYMVNYHAIRHYFELMGGVSYYSTDKNLDLNTQVSILTRDKETVFENLRYYFKEKIERWNPINFLYTITNLMDDNTKDNLYLRMSGLLAFFRLNLCDPSTFCRFAGQMIDSLDGMSFVQRVDLLKVLDKVWENYYQFGGEANVPFWIGQILFGSGLHEKAYAFFEKSIETHGAHTVVYYFMGKCLENMSQLQRAREMYIQAIELDGTFNPAREALADVDVVLHERRSLDDILKI
jgi:tetratricopeptide (TPR) repeat protein